jgi:hypothetical protein
VEREAHGDRVVTLPPWIATNQREREEMYRWVDQILDDDETIDRILDETGDLMPRLNINKVTPPPPQRPDAAEMDAAWRDGNIEPLCKKYPHLTLLLKPPSKRKRNLWRNERELTDVDLIAFEVKLIEAIWKKHYGHIRRPRGQLTAVDIVVRRLGLDQSARDRYEHPSGKK